MFSLYRIAAVVCLLACALPSAATSYTVKAGGGGNFTTMAACATQMSTNGTGVSDTCTVFAGTYNETVTVPAGSTGNYKIFTVNGADVVDLGAAGSFTLNSHTKLSGFVFNHTGTCLALNSTATDVFIGPNNSLTQCGTIGIASGNSFIYIQGNTMAWAGCTPPTPGPVCGRWINAFGNSTLIENNDFSHYQLAVVVGGTVAVNNIIIRNNTFHDQLETEAGSNGHTDPIFSEPQTGVTNVLEEGNIVRNAVGGNAKAFLSQDDAGCASTSPTCHQMIIRFNVISRIGSGGVTNDKTWPFVKVYNNTWVDPNMDAATTFAGTNNSITAANAAYLNDIYYYTQSSINDFNPYYCNNTDCSYGHNLYWCTGTCTLFHSHTYGSGTFTTDPGNLNSDPKFTSYISAGNSGNNYQLKSGSPAIGAGTNLTTTSGTGSSSTSMIVVDASYFQDGYGLSNANSTVTGDCIAINTVSNNVCITAVNYATNTLTLASAKTWASGDKIYLYSKSDGAIVWTNAQSNPDMGAFPFTPAPTIVPSASLSNGAKISNGAVAQ